MKDIGVTYPNVWCGRRVLYSRSHGKRLRLKSSTSSGGVAEVEELPWMVRLKRSFVA
jgi:hypothetical protein